MLIGQETWMKGKELLEDNSTQVIIILPDLSKKQNYISLSTAEAEYMAIGSCCAHLHWMKQMLSDHGICYNFKVANQSTGCCK